MEKRDGYLFKMLGGGVGFGISEKHCGIQLNEFWDMFEHELFGDNNYYVGHAQFATKRNSVQIHKPHIICTVQHMYDKCIIFSGTINML